MNLDLVLARPCARGEALAAVRAERLPPAALAMHSPHVDLGNWIKIGVGVRLRDHLFCNLS